MKSKFPIFLYLFVSAFFLFDIYLSTNDLSFKGYYADKIINWTWLTLTFIIIIYYRKSRVARFYFLSLIILVCLSILPAGIPFIGIEYFFSTIDDYQQIKINDKYRIERTRTFALSMPSVIVFESEGILEKQIIVTDYSELLCNTLEIPRYSYSYPDRNKTEIQKAKLISSNSDSIGIEYTILNKTNIYYHKFKKIVD